MDKLLQHVQELRPFPVCHVSQELTFQLTDIVVDDLYRSPKNLHLAITNVPYISIDSEDKWSGLYSAYLFGVTQSGTSICCRYSGFKPWFSIEIEKREEESMIRRNIHQSLGHNINDVQMTVYNQYNAYGWTPDDNDVTKTKQVKYLRINYSKSLTKNFLLHRNGLIRDYYRKGKIIDAKTDPAQQFLMQIGVSPMQWVTVISTKVHPIESRYTSTEIEVDCESIQLNPTISSIAPLLIASFDIEVYSSLGTMPNFNNEKDIITTISTVFSRYGNNNTQSKTITLSIDGVRNIDEIREMNDDFKEDQFSYSATSSSVIFFFPTEKELLLGFRDLILLTHPTILTGFNTSGFDNLYIEGRSVYLKLCPPSIPHVVCINSNDNLKKLKRDYFYLVSEESTKRDEDEEDDDDTDENSIHTRVRQENQSKEQTHQLAYEIERQFHYLPTLSRMQFWGVFLHDRTPLYRKQLSSAALNLNILYLRRWKGIIDIDVYLMMKFYEKLNSYSLESVTHHYFPEETSHAKKVLVDPSWKKTTMEACSVFIGGNQYLQDILNKICQMQEGTREADRECQKFKISVSDIFKNEVSLQRRQFIEKSCHDLAVIWGTDNYKRLFEMVRRGNRSEFIEISSYCEIDCQLVIQILYKSNLILRISKGAEVSKTLPKYFVICGQQQKVYNQLMWFCHRENYALNKKAIPNETPPERDENEVEEDEDSYEGAIVIEPKAGYYENPVAVFDFASLYPSIIQAYNFCPSTLILDQSILLRSDIQNALATNRMSIIEIEGNIFIQHIQGIIPRILVQLIQERKRIKELMELHPEMWELYDNWQRNVKIMANSVYGFFGVNETIAKYPCLPVAVCTTSKGRELITMMKTKIEEMGYDVIYGDTDSVMVHIPLENREISEVFAQCSEIGQRLNSQLPSTIRLMLEKIFFPFFLLMKKTYVGLKYEMGKQEGKMELKGVEPVKRNHPPFIQKTIGDLFESIVHYQNPVDAYTNLRQAIANLIDGKISYEDCTFTVTRNKEKPGLIAFEVVKKMELRREIDIPGPGNRIRYVVCFNPFHEKVSDRVESSEFAEVSNMPIDRKHLLMKGLFNGVLRISNAMGPKFPPVCSLFEVAQQIIESHERKMQNGGSTVDSFFSASSTSYEQRTSTDRLPTWDECFSLSERSKLQKKKCRKKEEKKNEMSHKNVMNFFK